MNLPAPRFDIELPVELFHGESDKPFLGVSVNLSETGMLIVAEETRPRGTLLRFGFHQFGGSAEVIWIREDEEGETLLGVKFLALKRGARKTLKRILEAPPTLSSA